MNFNLKKRLPILCLVLLFAAASLNLAAPDAFAGKYKSRSYSKSKSWSSSSSWSKSSSASKSVFGKRSGGGIFGTKKSSGSSGYSKPKTTKTTSSSSGYSKPKTAKKTYSSSGYSKPGTVKKASGSDGYTKKTATSSSSGYSKPKPSTKKKSFSGGSAYDKKTAKALKKKKAAASFAAYKSEKSKFKKSSETKSQKSYNSSPIYRNAKKYSDFDYRTQYNHRNYYYGRYGWSAPGYAYSSTPRFGMWDAMVWWMVLDNLGSRNHYAMAYNHANDPGYKEWRAEAERMARDNTELKAKLALLDQKVASMEGEPVDPGYLPSDMPAEVALAADVMASKKAYKPELKLATASATGNYQHFGKLLKEYATGIDVQLRTSAGSMENLRMLIGNEVDAAIIQSDAFDVYRKQFPNSKTIASEQTSLYNEAVQMIANAKSGIKTVQDIKPGGEHILFIGPRGSGTAMTWAGLCNQDASYAKIKTRHSSYETALQRVIEDPNAVMMFVSGLNSNLLRDAENEARINKTIRLVEVNDWDFNDARDSHGNKIYRFVNIPSEVYPGLQKAFIVGRDIETVAVTAVLAIRTDWAREYGPEAMDALSFAIMETTPLIRKRTNGLAK